MGDLKKNEHKKVKFFYFGAFQKMHMASRENHD